MQIHAAFQATFERMISQYGGISNGGMAFDPVSRVLLIYPRGNLSKGSQLLHAMHVPCSNCSRLTFWLYMCTPPASETPVLLCLSVFIMRWMAKEKGCCRKRFLLA